MIPERNFIYLHFAYCDVGGSGASVRSLRGTESHEGPFSIGFMRKTRPDDFSLGGKLDSLGLFT